MTPNLSIYWSLTLLRYTPRVRSRSEDRRAWTGGGSRSSDAPPTTAGSLSAAGDGPSKADPIARRCRGHRTPDSLGRTARHFGAFSRMLVTTSGESVLLPVWNRHPKLKVGQRRLTSCSNSDIPPSFSCIIPAFRTFRVQIGG